MKIIKLLTGVLCAVVLSSCNNFFHELAPPAGNEILSFELPGQLGDSQIQSGQIGAVVSPDTELRLTPRVTASQGAAVLPLTFEYIRKALPSADLAAVYRDMNAAKDMSGYITGVIESSADFTIPVLDTPIDFSGPVNFVVISAQGTGRQYTVTVTRDSGEANITAFGFSKYDNPELTADADVTLNENALTIDVLALYPAEMEGLSFSLVPGFELQGDSLEVDGVTIQSGGDADSNAIAFAHTFTPQTKTITVTREGYPAKDYTLTVTFAEDQDTVRAITDFRFYQTGNASIAYTAAAAISANGDTGTIKVSVIYRGAKPLSLVPQFISPGTVSADFGAGYAAQTTGVSGGNYAAPVKYRVVSKQGGFVRVYTVSVEFVSANDLTPHILGFRFSQSLNPELAGAAEGDIPADAELIVVDVSYTGATVPAVLIPEFSATGTVKVLGQSQLSGGSAHDFSRQVRYTVESADYPDLVRAYWVFSRDTSPDATMSAFGFYPDENSRLADPAEGKIDQESGAIAVYLPFGAGSADTPLIPRFTLHGTAKTAGVVQESWVSGQMFNVPVAYTVESANGMNFKNYTVTVREVNSRIYVKKDAAGLDDGSSWQNAFTTINKACAAASALPADTPKEIWIARGKYRPSETGDMAAQFTIPANMSFLGGFNGTESAKNQREPELNPVIISGDLGGGEVLLPDVLYPKQFRGMYL